MAIKKGPSKKAPIEKKEFNLDAFKVESNLMVDKVKDKELSFIPFSKAFSESTSLPGIPRGYVVLFRGFSDTGKSTAIYESVLGSQMIGDLAVIIDTENSWNWDHAKEMGIKFEEIADEATGEVVNYKGNFIYVSNDTLLTKYGYHDYADNKEKKEKRTEAVSEDVSRYINELLDAQANDRLPYNLTFLWDSIGTLECYQSVMSDSRNAQWNAGALGRCFNSIINHKIPSSRKEGKPFINTLICVQKIWIDNMGMGVVKHKGGEAFFSGARLIFHMGGIKSHGTTNRFAKVGEREYTYGTEVNIEVIKNHVNGMSWKGKIMSTAHGFINPINKNEYTTEHKDFLLKKIGAMEGSVIEFGERKGDDNDIFVQ